MTIRISEYRSVITALAAFVVFFDCGDAVPLRAQNLASGPDVHRIVESSIAATQSHWLARLRYTYIERDEDRRRDSAGRVTSEDVDVSRTILVNGVPFDQLVERNGRTPSAKRKGNRKRNSTS